MRRDFLGMTAVILFTAVLPQQSMAQKLTAADYLTFNGTVRTKYEYKTRDDEGRFEVRNCRLSASGRILPAVAYKAEIDLSDEGEIKMRDAYVELSPLDGLELTVGQMRVPFTIDAHRSPHRQYFANRSFIAKQVANIRDVGAMAGYTFCLSEDKDGPGEAPVTAGTSVTLEGGLFNGSGLTDQKDYWTKSYNYSLKASALIDGQMGVVVSCMHMRPAMTGIMMWNGGAYWHAHGWHVEAEYLRKEYSGGAFKAVNAVDAFVAKRLPMRKVFDGVSLLGRYDYMDDHSDGTPDGNGRLTIDDPQRHRITAGATLHLGGKSLKTDIRLNYEKYFYGSDATPNVSERDKIVVELMCRF